MPRCVATALGKLLKTHPPPYLFVGNGRQDNLFICLQGMVDRTNQVLEEGISMEQQAKMLIPRAKAKSKRPNKPKSSKGKKKRENHKAYKKTKAY